MKKTGIAVVVMLLAVGALAQSEVKSVNAVGYVKVTLPGNKLTMCAFNFDPVNGTNGVPLADVLGDQLVGGGSVGDSDNVIVWSRSLLEYETFFKIPDYGWYTPGFELMTNRVYNGDAFWIFNRQSSQQEVTFAGEVVDIPAGTNSLQFGQGLTMFGYPYPAEKMLSTTALFDAAQKAYSVGDADNLIVWDSDAQEYITYFPVPDYGWVDAAAGFDLVDFPVEMGRGMWYVRKAATPANWMEPQPYSLDD